MGCTYAPPDNRKSLISKSSLVYFARFENPFINHFLNTGTNCRFHLKKCVLYVSYRHKYSFFLFLLPLPLPSSSQHGKPLKENNGEPLNLASLLALAKVLSPTPIHVRTNLHLYSTTGISFIPLTYRKRIRGAQSLDIKTVPES